MRVFPIHNEQDHDKALARIETLMDRNLTPAEGDELDVLVTLVDAYETEHFPIEAPTPIAVIEFFLDQNGLTRKDLEPLIGSRARVSEVMNGKRSLTLAMIRRLRDEFGISADLLLEPMPNRRPHRSGQAKAPASSTRKISSSGVTKRNKRKSVAA
jgi:HTH-type transcriptional regulator / antitoxin HigA